MDYRSPEEYANIAKDLFLQGYNCSQSILVAFSDFTSLDDKLAKMISSPFGGGMGRMREVCGAVSGMFMVLGILDGYTDPTDDESKTELYKTVQDLAKQFETENGSIICRELLGLNIEKDSYIPSKRDSKYYESRPCPEKVASAARILAQYLLNGKKEDL